MSESAKPTIIERLLELNKPAALDRVIVRRQIDGREHELARGPMSFEPRDSDGDMVFTVGEVSFLADQVVSIDNEVQIVWLAPAEERSVQGGT